MDSEVWASLLSAAKRRPALHPYRADRTISHEDLEAHDDMLIEFTCPFCCGEFDIGSLCSHIEEKHCFEPKAAVCPVCAAKVKSDMVGHITFQHGHLFKMQRRRFRMAVTSVGSALSSVVKERGMVALQAHPNGISNSHWSAAKASHPGTDPLANLLYGLPLSDAPDTIAKTTEVFVKDKECVTHQLISTTFPVTEECKQQLKAAALCANFLQQLMLSTIFSDS